MSFKIVVDSCCDLTPQMAQGPLLCEGSALHPRQRKRLCGRRHPGPGGSALVHAPERGRTAPPPVPRPRPTWTHTRERRGRTSMWLPCPPCSAALTDSAEQARVLLEEEQPERNIHVFNSCSASSGEVLAALKIQELASSGVPFKKGGPGGGAVHLPDADPVCAGVAGQPAEKTGGSPSCRRWSPAP